MSELLESVLDGEQRAACAANDEQQRQWLLADAQRTPPYWPFAPLNSLQLRRRRQQEEALRERALRLRRKLVHEALEAASPAPLVTVPGSL